MKKLMLFFVFGVALFLLSGCTAPTNTTTTTNAQLPELLTDTEYNTSIYNEVCFNVYIIGKTSWQADYEWTRNDCYYINTSEYPHGSDPLTPATYDMPFKGILKSALSKSTETKYNVPIYNASQSAVTNLPPVCGNQTSNDTYCISTDYLTKNDITLNAAIILLN